MAKKEYKLPEMKKGYYLFWSVCTQCMYNCSVKMEDESSRSYFNCSKSNRRTDLQVLEQGNRQLDGNGLKLIIEVPESAEIKQSIPSGAITDNSGATVGYVYSFCIEDSTDEDYNDIYINVVGWKNKG